ncbi:MAG: Ribosome-binding factor, partial [Patescibacteria group bacterium]|nr:Ribosome-binding factor [Patescibacteria group bacterium]
MSQRAAKVESLIQTVVATALRGLLERDATNVTVTRVDAAADLRNVTVWIGLLGDQATQERLWKRIEGVRGELQLNIGAKMTTKFVPRLHVKR